MEAVYFFKKNEACTRSRNHMQHHKSYVSSVVLSTTVYERQQRNRKRIHSYSQSMQAHGRMNK